MKKDNKKGGLRQQLTRRFNSPYEFSFKDLLAVVFVISFLYISWRTLKDKASLELVKTWMPIIMTVLGGYFCTEVASAYLMSKGTTNQNTLNNGYLNYNEQNNSSEVYDTTDKPLKIDSGISQNSEKDKTQ